MENVYALEPVIILLLVGILAITLMRPLGMSPIVGYLIAGIVIGPHGLALIEASSTTQLLAELGVVFLLFDIGLHFSLARLRESRRDILGLGPLQVVLCTTVFGALALAAGLGPRVAVIIGATLALSSTAVAVQTLNERGQQRCPVGTTATAVLIFQDICAIFLLILATSLTNAAAAGQMIALAAVKSAVAFAAAILIGRYFIGPFFNLLGKTRSEELFTAIALLIVLVTAAATGALGLSLTLGAFLGGMILAETPYRQLIQTEVKPFRGLLLGFFFITVGMTLDPALLARNGVQVLLALLLLIGLKTVLVLGAALLLRAPLRVAVQLGFLLSQGSEFAFVILAMPAIKTALGVEPSAILLTAIAASLALTPVLSLWGNHIAKRLAGRALAVASDTPVTAPIAPVIIFGMGEIGRRVADALEAHAIGYTAIEMDHDRFIRANADGYPVAFGDAADLRLMETFEIAERPTIVITIVRYEISRDLTPILRQRYPHLARFIAVENDEDRRRFEALGMRAVVNRSQPRGIDLAAAVLGAHGVSDDRVHAWMQRQQEEAFAVAPLAKLAGEGIRT
jgi:monovalent cation:proton antiporter-2 (CPA2) family protein